MHLLFGIAASLLWALGFIGPCCSCYEKIVNHLYKKDNSLTWTCHGCYYVVALIWKYLENIGQVPSGTPWRVLCPCSAWAILCWYITTSRECMNKENAKCISRHQQHAPRCTDSLATDTVLIFNLCCNEQAHWGNSDFKVIGCHFGLEKSTGWSIVWWYTSPFWRIE